MLTRRIGRVGLDLGLECLNCHGHERLNILSSNENPRGINVPIVIVSDQVEASRDFMTSAKARAQEWMGIIDPGIEAKFS